MFIFIGIIINTFKKKQYRGGCNGLSEIIFMMQINSNLHHLKPLINRNNTGREYNRDKRDKTVAKMNNRCGEY